MSMRMVRKAIRYFQEAFTLYRNEGAEAGWDTETGKYTRAQNVQLHMVGTVLNTTDEELQQVTEAERTEGMKTVYSISAIKTTDEKLQTYSDLMLHDGIMYRAVKAYPRNQGGYYKTVFGRYDFSWSDDTTLVFGFGSGFGYMGNGI